LVTLCSFSVSALKPRLSLALRYVESAGLWQIARREPVIETRDICESYSKLVPTLDVWCLSFTFAHSASGIVVGNPLCESWYEMPKLRPVARCDAPGVAKLLGSIISGSGFVVNKDRAIVFPTPVLDESCETPFRGYFPDRINKY
jgi:hypothetical protein